jgi:hypothetical protein
MHLLDAVNAALLSAFSVQALCRPPPSHCGPCCSRSLRNTRQQRRPTQLDCSSLQGSYPHLSSPVVRCVCRSAGKAPAAALAQPQQQSQ